MTVSIPDLSTLPSETYESLDNLLNGKENALHERFRALFTLKNLSSDKAVDIVAKGFSDDSALFKHEIAYVLGQMQNKRALPYLEQVLENSMEDSMVRHEAAEAIGAIGDIKSLTLLQRFYGDKSEPAVVRETCELAIAKIQHENNSQKEKPSDLSTDDDDMAVSASGYSSVDPAPCLPETQMTCLKELGDLLMDTKQPLFMRYRAMFSLRNIGTKEAVEILALGFSDGSALFRHEIAYVYGQMQDPLSVPHLTKVLEDPNETAMVRHECAEALGSIASADCLPVLERFSQDPERVVRESCLVALDMYQHENSGEFQYANGLSRA